MSFIDKWMRSKAGWVGIIKFLLIPASYFYGVITSCRRKFYDLGFFSSYRSLVPVISIGNLTAGGSGKTPFTLFLLSLLLKKGKVAVLTRGYRSGVEKNPIPLALCMGKGPLFSAEFGGDEPYLLAQRAPQSFIFVGQNRVLGAKMAEGEGVRWILLDDGFQHLKLKRDEDIVLLNGENPWGYGYPLPRGLLREFPSALKKATLVVVHHFNKASPEWIESLQKKLSCPLIGTQVRARGLLDLDNRSFAIPFLEPMGLFCGLANPSSFLETALSLGIKVMGYRFFPDHASYSFQNLGDWAQDMKDQGAKYLICSEKDSVKINFNLPLKVLYLPMDLQIVYGQKKFEEWFSRYT